VAANSIHGRIDSPAWTPRLRPCPCCVRVPSGVFTSFIAPCLPTLAKSAPAGGDWLHEIKHDGFRLMVRRDVRSVRLLTRNGHDFSDRFPAVAAAAFLVRKRSFLIDSEAVVCRADGLAVFDLLRHGPRRNEDAILYAFDLLEVDGEDLRPLPIEDRKHRLLRLLRPRAHAIPYNEHVQGSGTLVYLKACELGCEGIVSKRRDSPYVSGRSKHWIKTKNPASPAARRLAEEDWN
jgi:bifunctional non-homologous end joining protein LigD